MSIRRPGHLFVISAASALACLNSVAVCAAQADFASAVTATHPIAYFRLDATSGKSEVGASTYKSAGGVTTASPGALGGASPSQFARFDGRSGSIVTTQAGGIATAASIMAWVHLAALPSKEAHIFYVAGESQSGNDFDLQIETDNVLRFFTAAGGNLEFKLPPATLVNQWHLIVVTLDTVSQIRTIYWDGKSVATDKGGGRAPKTAVFSIGESTVFTGRFFHGGIEDVALWNRALKPAEVTAIYAAAKPDTAAAAAGAASSAPAASGPTPTTGPFATKAKVEADDASGHLKLKREEQIALMFLSAIEQIEHDCQLTLQRACTFNELLGGIAIDRRTDKLKFDPNKTDPNYTYTLTSGGMAWEAHANPKKPGLTGFCWMARNIGTTVTTYNPAGPATWVDKEVTNRGIEGDTFAIE
jgi:hypothetical protein